MPIHKVGGGWKYGKKGKLYKGKGAKLKAIKQALAIHYASGEPFKEEEQMSDEPRDPKAFSRLVMEGNYDESKHKRDESGKFTATTGNPSHGAFGDLLNKHGEEKAHEHYQAMGQHLMTHHGASEELAKHYLDSTHGRHVAGHFNDSGDIHTALMRHHRSGVKLHSALREVANYHEIGYPAKSAKHEPPKGVSFGGPLPPPTKSGKKKASVADKAKAFLKRTVKATAQKKIAPTGGMTGGG